MHKYFGLFFFFQKRNLISFSPGWNQLKLSFIIIIISYTDKKKTKLNFNRYKELEFIALIPLLHFFEKNFFFLIKYICYLSIFELNEKYEFV